MSINAIEHTRAFSLIEAMVALIVLAIGLMGIARMILISHQANASSYMRQQAVQSANDIIDNIRANRAAALNGSYAVSNLVSSGTPTIPSAPSTNCSTTSCTTTQLAAYDTWDWLANNLTKLPNGSGSITTSASGANTLLTVTIRWSDTPAQQVLSASSVSVSQLTIQTQL